MHTRSVFSSRPSTHAKESGLGCRLSLLMVVVGLLLAPQIAIGQVGFPGAPDEPDLNLRVYPLDTWSPRVGIGMGAGLVMHHLGRSNAQGLLTFAPARHEQVATLAWASANPHRARQYVLLDARGVHTNRDWFYGLGPRASAESRTTIERSALRLQARAGQAFLDHKLVVQPHLRVSTHRIDHIPNEATPALDPSSRTHLEYLADDDLGLLEPTQTGLRVGLGVIYDTRPRHARPTRGVRLSAQWSRYADLSSSLVRFDQLDLGASGHLPLTGAHRLSAHVRLTLTDPRGGAPVPYYLQPTLDGPLAPGWACHRFVDLDRLVTSALYRFPIAEAWGIVQMEGHLGAHAASVYHDFPSDAALGVSFDETLEPSGSAVPLRPSASLGLHLGLSFRQAPSLDVAVGASPEGVTAVRFGIEQDLLSLRPPHHDIRAW